MMKNEQEKRGLDNLISYQGDSHQQEKMTENRFDMIFGCNLIDRLHTPIDWIKQSKVETLIWKKKTGFLKTISGYVDRERNSYHCLSIHLEA